MKNIYYREDKPYYIYIHTCPNHWCYVGMSKNPKQRWNKGEGYKDNKDFYKTIKRSGWENIKHDIVATTHYRWVAQKIERTLITDFKRKGRCFNENNIETKLLTKQKAKKVAQYDKETKELIKEFDSVKQARDFTGGSTSGIREACTGKLKTSGGYIWKYL